MNLVKQITAGEFSNDWYKKYVEEQDYTSQTKDYYRSIVNKFSNYFIERPLVYLTEDDINSFITYFKNDYKKKCGGPLSNRTLDNISMIANRIYNEAKRYY